jgi:hypothetical protein
MAPQANASPTTTPPAPSAPLKHALAAMLGALARLTAPVIPAQNEPRHFDAVAGHMIAVAEIVDDYMTAIGDHVAEHATVKIDLSQFAAPLLATIEGNAIYEIERAAEAVREELCGHYAPGRFAR